MEHAKPDVDPKVVNHITHAIHEEWQAFLSLVRFQWPIVLLFLCGLGVLLYVARPLPPQSLRLASGQPQSSLELLSKRYAAYFAAHGVRIELVASAGAFENVELLNQGKVDAAFSLGGMVQDKVSTDVVSLGSVEYQPLWFFHRGKPYDGTNPTAFFKSLRLSINLPGSGTHSLSRTILELHGIAADNNPRIQFLSSADSVAAVQAGQLDGMFLVAGIESKTIERLLQDPSVQVMHFTQALAYTKRLPFLEVVQLPRGGFDLVRDQPPHLADMAATTTTVLTTEDMHPTLQQLFLQATRAPEHQNSQYFTRPGGFPAYVSGDIALSKTASRYYESGPPALAPYLPFWLASFLDQVWFLLFAAFAIGYPLFKVFPSYRIVYAQLCMTDCFEDLRVLDKSLHDATTPEKLRERLEQFDRIEQRVNHLWIPAGARESFYNLRNSVEILRSKTQRMKAHVESLNAASFNT